MVDVRDLDVDRHDEQRERAEHEQEPVPDLRHDERVGEVTPDHHWRCGHSSNTAPAASSLARAGAEKTTSRKRRPLGASPTREDLHAVFALAVIQAGVAQRIGRHDRFRHPSPPGRARLMTAIFRPEDRVRARFLRHAAALRQTAEPRRLAALERSALCRRPSARSGPCRPCRTVLTMPLPWPRPTRTRLDLRCRARA